MLMTLVCGSHKSNVGKKEKKELLNCMCNLLLKHNANILFLKHITMDDEKWILYMRSAGKQHEPLNLQPIIEANGIESLLLRELI